VLLLLCLQEDINNNISQEEAAAKEREFFERDSFFGSADVVSVRERFGVDALRVQLSKQLVSLTQRELPKMKEALDEVLAQVGPHPTPTPNPYPPPSPPSPPPPHPPPHWRTAAAHGVASLPDNFAHWLKAVRLHIPPVGALVCCCGPD
jgi:hypothetical protein